MRFFFFSPCGTAGFPSHRCVASGARTLTSYREHIYIQHGTAHEGGMAAERDIIMQVKIESAHYHMIKICEFYAAAFVVSVSTSKVRSYFEEWGEASTY